MQYLKFPQLNDPVKQRQANLIHGLILSVVLCVFFFIIVTWFFIPTQRSRVFPAFLVLIPSFISLWLNHKGHVVFASWIIVFGLWGICTYSGLTNGGVRAPGYTGYFIVILMAGVMINYRAAVFFSLLCLVSGYVFVLQMRREVIDGLPPPETIWLVTSIMFFVVIALTYYATNNISQALAQARTEIAVRKRTEAALQRSETRYKRLLEDIWDMVYALSLDGRILELNPAFEELLGYQTSNWIGKSFLPLVLPEDQDALWNQFQKVLRLGERARAAGECRLITKKGDIVLVEYAFSLGEDNGDTKIVGIARNITEKRQAEEALQQTQKLDSLGMMAGGVAHDFNNLLVGMLAQTSLAERLLPDDSPATEPIQKAVRAAEQAANLTRQLLAYSGRGEFEIRPLNINRLIHENLHILELAIPKNVAIVTELYEPLPTVEADKGQIQQIVMNLIINASQAIGLQVGKITIKTDVCDLVANDSHFSRLTGRPLPAGPYVLFSIADDGKGMDKDTLAHIFDPFYSTKEDGYGLGLAAVLGIVRGHRGGIVVSSEIGQGTMFELVFPQSAEQDVLDTAVSESNPQKNSKGTVLVIDDELFVREAASDILTLHEIDVLLANNGQMGVEVFVEHQNKIALVLLDLSMPGLSGEETLSLLREKDEEVKVILTSGYSKSEMMDGLHGAIDFLQKPYNLEQLVTKVKLYL